MSDQLQNSDALELFSSRKELFHCSLLFLFSCLSFHKKDFGHCLVMYSFLSVRQVDFFPLGRYKIQLSTDLSHQTLFISKVIIQNCLEDYSKADPCGILGISLSILVFRNYFLWSLRNRGTAGCSLFQGHHVSWGLHNLLLLFLMTVLQDRHYHPIL